MRLFIVIALTLLAALDIQTHPQAQDKRCTEMELPKYCHLDTLKKRPDLGIDYARVTNFKLASRKTTYRMDELISIDLAMMNTSDAHLFSSTGLHGQALQSVCRMRRARSQMLSITGLLRKIATEEDYVKLYPNTFISGSFELLAGCEVSARAYLSEREKLLNDIAHDRTNIYKGMFERDLFASWGKACLNLKKPGTYIITAEMSNDYVMASACESEVKTAVGKIRSAPLKITIVE